MKYLLHLAILLASTLLVFSACKVEKRLHRPGYHVEWKKSAPAKAQSTETASRKDNGQESQKTDDEVNKVIAAPDLTAELKSKERKSPKTPNDNLALRIASDYRYNHHDVPDLFFEEECETLVMVDGRRLFVKVIEINQHEIKYKKCDYLQGPTVVVGKKDVDRIIYSNGAVDIISGYSAPESRSPRSTPESDEQPIQKRMEVMALLSMLFGITGLFIAAIVFGLMALIFGIVSLMKISANPREFGGRGMALAGIIIGLLDVALFLLIVSSNA